MREVWIAFRRPAMLHIGGDEVPSRCWERGLLAQKGGTGDSPPKTKNSFNVVKHQTELGFYPPAVNEVMEREASCSDSAGTVADTADTCDGTVTSANALFDLFTTRMARWISRSLSPVPSSVRTVFWDEASVRASPTALSNAVIQVWRTWGDAPPPSALVERGFDVILSSSNLWYLDHTDVSFPAFYKGPPEVQTEHVAGGSGRILGAEAPMWSELVDPSRFDATVYPKLALLSERLWSPLSKTKSWSTARPRLQKLRCLLLKRQRGIDSGPVDYRPRAELESPGSCLQMPEASETDARWARGNLVRAYEVPMVGEVEVQKAAEAVRAGVERAAGVGEGVPGGLANQRGGSGESAT